LLASVLLCSHWLGCIKYAVHDADGLMQWSEAYVYDFEKQTYAEHYFVRAARAALSRLSRARHVTNTTDNCAAMAQVSLLFGIATLTGLGSSMVPETNAEHALSVTALALGVMSATYIIGALRSRSCSHSRPAHAPRRPHWFNHRGLLCAKVGGLRYHAAVRVSARASFACAHG
jgi:hypothetical protein